MIEYTWVKREQEKGKISIILIDERQKISIGINKVE